MFARNQKLCEALRVSFIGSCQQIKYSKYGGTNCCFAPGKNSALKYDKYIYIKPEAKYNIGWK